MTLLNKALLLGTTTGFVTGGLVATDLAVIGAIIGATATVVTPAAIAGAAVAFVLKNAAKIELEIENGASLSGLSGISYDVTGWDADAITEILEYEDTNDVEISDDVTDAFCAARKNNPSLTFIAFCAA